MTGSLWQHEIKRILFYCWGSSLSGPLACLRAAWRWAACLMMSERTTRQPPGAIINTAAGISQDSAVGVLRNELVSLLHCYWSPDFLTHFHIMGSTDLISQKRGWVITCHFNNVFYCLQALVVPSRSNGGFNAKWNRERRIERRGQRRREGKGDWAQEYDWFIQHDLLFLQFHALDCAERSAGRAGCFPDGHKVRSIRRDSWDFSGCSLMSERRIHSFGLWWKKNQPFWTISQKRLVCWFAGLKTRHGG